MFKCNETVITGSIKRCNIPADQQANYADDVYNERNSSNGPGKHQTVSPRILHRIYENKQLSDITHHDHKIIIQCEDKLRLFVLVIKFGAYGTKRYWMWTRTWLVLIVKCFLSPFSLLDDLMKFKCCCISPKSLLLKHSTVLLWPFTVRLMVLLTVCSDIIMVRTEDLVWFFSSGQLMVGKGKPSLIQVHVRVSDWSSHPEVCNIFGNTVKQERSFSIIFK